MSDPVKRQARVRAALAEKKAQEAEAAAACHELESKLEKLAFECQRVVTAYRERQLAPLVDDVELVLFESDEYGSDLPGEDVIAELRQLAQAHNLTYTVHLPLDLRLGDGDDWRHPSLEKALRVIEREVSVRRRV